ncbi:MAG: DUF1501 domain-containing protein [Planctomycetota bacterium]
MLGMDRRQFLGTAGAATAMGWAIGSANASGAQVLLVHLVGGPSQLDTWDPKPGAASECRGPFGSIATRVPGARLGELFPRLADRLDRVTLVRTLHHDAEPTHEAGFRILNTGTAGETGHASGLARAAGGMAVPGRVGTLGQAVATGQEAALESRGWAVAGHQPNPVRLFGEALEALSRGSRMVTVNTAETVFNRITWDCHADMGALAGTLSDYRDHLAPSLDHGLGWLIDTLESRGLWDRVLVVVAGEMGRSPRLNARGGRDHWTGAWSGLVFGAGAPRGQVVGATDRDGAFPVSDPVPLSALHGMMARALGAGASSIGENA